MPKSLKNKNNRKRSIRNKNIFGGRPSHQETLYIEGYKLYQEFLEEYNLYYEIDADREPERFQEVVNKAQRLLKNAIEKLQEAVSIRESDELTMKAAFLIYVLSKVDEDDLTYDMMPSDVANYLKIAADLDHGKACYLYSQRRANQITWKGYSSSSEAKQAYLDRAYKLKVPEAFVSRVEVIIDNPRASMEEYRNGLSLLCEAYKLYKYIESGYSEQELVIKGYTSRELSNSLDNLHYKIAYVFNTLFMNEVMYIVAESKYVRIEELYNLVQQFNNFVNEKNRLYENWNTLTSEENDRYYTLHDQIKELSPLISEMVFILHEGNELTDNFRNSHPSFRP